jgi:hypothetical protein
LDPQGGTFELVPSDKIKAVLLKAPEGGGGELEGAGGGGGGAALEPEPAPCYCADKFRVKFVDMLTYPRPVRTFEVRHAGCGCLPWCPDVGPTIGRHGVL